MSASFVEHCLHSVYNCCHGARHFDDFFDMFFASCGAQLTFCAPGCCNAVHARAGNRLLLLGTLQLADWICSLLQVLDINALMILATLGALAIQDYTEGAAVLVLFAVASWLEEGCGRRARDAVSAVVAMQPAFATLASGMYLALLFALCVSDVLPLCYALMAACHALYLTSPC